MNDNERQNKSFRIVFCMLFSPLECRRTYFNEIIKVEQ